MSKRAILYARVSGRHQVENTSLDNQIAQMREYCARLGYTIVEEIREQYSGAYADRPGINRMKLLGQRGEANVVIVYHLDRFMRGDDADTDPGIDAALTERDLNRCGLEVEYLDLPDKDSEAYVYIKTIKRLVASIERRNIRTRTVEGKRRKVEGGKPFNSLPYGYRWEKPDDGPPTIVIVEKQAEVIRQVFRWFICGESVNQIAARLNAMGVLTPGDLKQVKVKKRGVGEWNGINIYHIVTQEGYTGNLPQYKRRCVTVYENGKRRVKVSERPRDEWVWVDIPPIISPETFVLAEERRLRNKPSGQRKYDKLFPPGTLTCARCGYSITHNRPSGHYYFICGGRRSDRAADCDLPTFDGHRVEEKVWEFVFNLIMDEDFLREKCQEIRTQRYQAARPLREQLSLVEAELAEDTRQLQNLLLALVKAEPLERSLLQPERERLNRAITHLEHRRSEIAAAIAANDIDEDAIQDLLDYVAQIRTGFGILQADPVFRDKVMRLFRVRVQLDERDGRKLALISCELGSAEVDVAMPEGYDIDTFTTGLFDT